MFAIPIGVSAYFLTVLAPRALDALGTGAGNGGAGVHAALAAFFGAAICAFVTMVDRSRRQLIATAGDLRTGDDSYARRVPGPLGTSCVLPARPTASLATVNFTAHAFQIFESRTRTFTFTSPEYAQQFAALNAGRVWTPGSPRARFAAVAWSVLILALAASAVLRAIGK